MSNSYQQKQNKQVKEILVKVAQMTADAFRQGQGDEEEVYIFGPDKVALHFKKEGNEVMVEGNEGALFIRDRLNLKTELVKDEPPENEWGFPKKENV